MFGTKSDAPPASGSLRIAFSGSGMMATAMIDGLLASGTVAEAADILVFDPSPHAQQKMRSRGISVCASNADLVRARPDALIIAVKPIYVPGVCREISPALSSSGPGMTAILSVAAGVTLETIRSFFPPVVHSRLVRVMPNTPALIGMGASAYCTAEDAPPATGEIAERILRSVGECVLCLPEHNMDAVTGVSGSGPAYVYAFVEAMSDGGVRAGLPRSAATALAVQTVRGAAAMIAKTGKHTGELKEMVTSPGGTTIAGVHALEQGNLRGTVMDAVVATTKRSMQLGGKTEDEIKNKCGL